MCLQMNNNKILNYENNYNSDTDAVNSLGYEISIKTIKLNSPSANFKLRRKNGNKLLCSI